MNFADRLNNAIKIKGSAICVGFDPVLSRIPAEIVKKANDEHGFTLEAAGAAISEFGRAIFEEVVDHAPVVKLQLAYFEQYGLPGMKAFSELCQYAKELGLLVIADGKRNDIDSTAEAYANAYLGKTELFGNSEFVHHIDALTVTPYLGYDGIKPFLKVCREFDKGVFVLVKTSNPSSGDFQDRITEDSVRNFEYIANFVDSWGADDLGESNYSFVGAVCGATYPKDLVKLRGIMPNTIFLVPGYGAQGGQAEDLKGIFDDDGLGAIVNSSRGIIYAYETATDLSYREATRNAVLAMKEDLKKARL